MLKASETRSSSVAVASGVRFETVPSRAKEVDDSVRWDVLVEPEEVVRVVFTLEAL
jgi:hypothetical protein